MALLRCFQYIVPEWIGIGELFNVVCSTVVASLLQCFAVTLPCWLAPLLVNFSIKMAT